jgi:hypothetical protein
MEQNKQLSSTSSELTIYFTDEQRAVEVSPLLKDQHL